MSAGVYSSSYRGANNPSAFYHIASGDWGGDLQPSLAAVGGASSALQYIVVPNSGSQWKVYKAVDFMRPDGVQDPTGLALTRMDCISPEYPGTGVAVTSGSNTWFVMNGYLFLCTTSGTTATTFIGFSAFNTTKGGTTTDGTAVWTCYGKAVLVTATFVNATAGSLTPATQSYDLFEL
jgi:hypothetical protein